MPASVRAEGDRVRIMTDVEYLYTDIHSKDKETGEKVDSQFSYFKQKYDVLLDKELYPFLGVRAGGLFEMIDTDTQTTDGPDTGNTQESLWLFSELNLTNPLYTGGLAYRRREFKFDPDDFPSTKISREEYSGILRWRPVGFPTTDLDINRFRVWDEDDTRDTLVDRVVLKNRYDYRDFAYDYTYTRVDTDKQIEDSGDLTQIHNGGASYSTRFFSDRVQLTTAARFDYQTVDPRGGEVIDRRTTPLGSPFYFLDDSDDDTLAEVGDDGFSLSNVNIGRNAPLNPVSVGLDFGPPTEVDTLFVQPLEDAQDPMLATPAEIASVANFFVWTVFESDDQENWDELTVFSAEYDVFDNRFEIRFEPTDTPYIKVVTTPQPSAPGEIRIADVQAFTSIETSPGMQIEDFDQTYTLGLQWQVADDTIASYDGYFRHVETQPFDVTRTRLTNGLSLQHYFNPDLFANARVLRSDGTETDEEDIVEHSYSASLRADYLDTLNQTLVFSGRHDEEERGVDMSNSIFLRTDADLYEGLSANVDLGYTWQSPLEEADRTIATLRVASRVDPNPKLNFTLDYQVSLTNESGGSSTADQLARFQGFWVPWRTLSFYASVGLRHDQRNGEGLKISQDYSANWSPFPDGLLTFSFAYNQSIDTEDNEVRAFSPQLDWQITRTTLLTLRASIGTLESDQETRDIKNIRATFRTFY